MLLYARTEVPRPNRVQVSVGLVRSMDVGDSSMSMLPLAFAGRTEVALKADVTPILFGHDDARATAGGVRPPSRFPSEGGPPSRASSRPGLPQGFAHGSVPRHALEGSVGDRHLGNETYTAISCRLASEDQSLSRGSRSRA